MYRWLAATWTDLNDTVTLTFAATQDITDLAGNALDTTGTPSPNDNFFLMDNTARR